MIIGNGLIANSLRKIDSDKILFFASGVSNSLEMRNSEFEREFSLLKESITNNSGVKVIYFSTLSIFDRSKKDSPYVIHKKNIEDYITENLENFLILRIGNIVGKGGNPNTLFNFLKSKIENQSQFAVHTNARRLLIDIDDISKFLSLLLTYNQNQVINCAYPYYYTPKEIIDVIQSETKKIANYDEIDEGDFYRVHFNNEIERFFSETNPTEYLEFLAKKYI